MKTSETEALKNLVRLNEAFDSLKKLVADLSGYIQSRHEVWRQLEFQRVVIDREVLSGLASSVEQDAELVATGLEKKE